MFINQYITNYVKSIFFEIVRILLIPKGSANKRLQDSRTKSRLVGQLLRIIKSPSK